MFPQTNPLMVDDCWFVLLFPLGSTGVLWETWPSHENSWRFRENRSWWIFQKATVGDNGGEMNKGRESRNISENAVWRCEMIWKNKNRVKKKNKETGWLVLVGVFMTQCMYVGFFYMPIFDKQFADALCKPCPVPDTSFPAFIVPICQYMSIFPSKIIQMNTWHDWNL